MNSRTSPRSLLQGRVSPEPPPANRPQDRNDPMPLIEASALRRGVLMIAASVVAACSQTPNRAPVEDRSPTPRTTVAAASPAQSPASAAEAAKPVAVDANLGKPGFYTVKPGDTLIRIGLD